MTNLFKSFKNQEARKQVLIDKLDRAIIDEINTSEHPLKNIPCFKFVCPDVYVAITFCRTCKFKSRSELRKEMEIEWLENDALAKETSHFHMFREQLASDAKMEYLDNPLHKFGFGIYQYMSFQKKLAVYLFIMSVIAIIQMYLIYSDLSNHEKQILQKEEKDMTLTHIITSFLSLGAYFQAYPLCRHVHLAQNNLQLECRGDMKIQEVFEVAILKNAWNLCTIDPNKFKNTARYEDMKTKIE